MDASGGSREQKDDDHQSNRRTVHFDNKSSDEVPQSSDQMEVEEDATGGSGRMFGNNDRVAESSNAEFIASQMDIRGSVGVVGGQVGNQFVQSSDNSDVLGQGYGQGTGGTGSVLHSESSSTNVHGQGRQGMHSQSVTPTATQYRRGRFTVTHEQLSAISGVSRPRGVHEHNVRVQSEYNIASGNNLRPRGPVAQSGSDTHTYQRGTGYYIPRGQNTGNTGSSSHGTALDHGNLLGQGQGTDGTGSVLHSESSNGHGQGQQGMHSLSVTPTATQYQRGRFTVTHEQPSAISGVSRPRGAREHNVRVRSDPNIASRNNLRPRGPLAQSGSDTHTCQRGTGVSRPRGVREHNVRVRSDPNIASRNNLRPRGPLAQSGSDTHTYQRGTGFSRPRGVHEHNVRVQFDPNMVRANMFRQGTPQVSQQIGFFGTPINPFFPTFASQYAGLPVAWPPVQSGTGFFMPQGAQEHNMRVQSNANMVSADMFRHGTPTFASQNASLPGARPPVHMGMSSNADMAVEAPDREEDVSDQGSTSEDS